VSVKGLLFRFMLLYAALMFAAGIVMNHFGLEGATGVSIGILGGCVFWVCGAFAKKNGRYFSGTEKWAVVLGLLAIVLFLQFLFVAVALSESPEGVNLEALIFAVVFVGVLHGIAIYFFVGLARKPLIKKGVISG
jgi:FlaA1/EpsC-like NDP-sugar epimerase